MIRCNFISLLLVVSLPALTGCPGSGDRLCPDETARVYTVGNSICFSVESPGDYQVADIGI